MLKFSIVLQLFISFITKCNSQTLDPTLNGKLITMQTFVYWPNATVPFFIDPDNFDHEQAIAIMKSLSMFAFKTCINFMPVMTAPNDEQHVLTFVNPEGLRRCRIELSGHSNFRPHEIQLGYDCLKSSEIDMIIMRALGLPFEHNRMSRDIYIDVKIENVEPSYIELFAKDSILPPALRAIPYDVNSVMHFGERDYSKNGHRTIIFKIPSMRPNKNGLSEADIKKIEMVYGPECRKRDRAEKYALCQSYPGLGRRKREAVEPFANISLRVNPNITPPPEILAAATEATVEEKAQSFAKVVAENDDSDDVTESLNTLDIVKETDKVLELIYQLSSQTLKNARDKYCNITSNSSSGFEFKKDEKKNQISADVFGIQKVIADFAKAVVDDAERNPMEFCQHSETIEAYQRQCRPDNDARCPKPFKSSKNGAGEGRVSTEHPDRMDDKKETADGTTTTPLILIRRKREASKNVTTPKSSTAVIEVTTPVATPKTSKVVKEATDNVTTPTSSAAPTTVTTPKPSKAIKKVTASITTPKSSKADKEGTSVTTTKSSKTVKQATTTITTMKSKKAVTEASNTFTLPKSPGNIELNLKERIKTMREDRLMEIQRVNMTAVYQLAAVPTDSKPKEDKTIISSLESKAKKMALMEEDKDVTPAKFEFVSSKTGSLKRRFVAIKKERLREIKKGKLRASVIEDKMEPFRRVSAEQRYAAESSQSSEGDETDDRQGSDISLYNEKEQRSVELTIKSYSADESAETTTRVAKHKRREPIETVVKETESDISNEPIPKKNIRQRKEKVHSSAAIPTTVPLSKLNVEFYADRRWPHGDLIYVIKELPDYNLEDLRDRLAEVNTILTHKTCVKLREVDIKEADGFEDYIILDNSTDFVTGRVGGKQNFGSIELFAGGHHLQHTAMMVMSMLGFYFEVSRHDRDKYIRVHNRHIRADKLHHFEKNGDEATLDLPYDFKSATHPSIKFWRKIGKKGISTVATYKQRDPDGSIMRSLGENSQLLSEYDIIKINSVYGVKCFLNQASRGRSVKKSRRARPDDTMNVV